MKRTVLFFSTSSGPGGAERVVSKLASSLDSHSFRPVVCLFRPGWLKEQCEQSSIPTYVIPNKGIFDFSWIKQFLWLLREERVAIIHAHEFDAIVHGTIAGCFARIPVVATIHGKHYFWEKPSRRMAYRLVSYYARVVAVSEDLQQFILNRVGISPGRISTVYNGVDISPDQIDITRCKRELGIDPDEQVVGSVGSLYPVKGHKYLLQAIPAILERIPCTTFLIIGRGELEGHLKDEVARLGLDHKVRFLGLRHDIQELLALMDVFVLPSLSEGLSIALLEAMAARRPVVATSVGGNPELVVDGETGYLVPAQEGALLASGILRLLSDVHLARRFGENGKRRVERYFSMTAMVNGYQDLYSRCLDINL
jgi:glycosyltransferase involved in cell wall biosynthesis